MKISNYLFCIFALFLLSLCTLQIFAQDKIDENIRRELNKSMTLFTDLKSLESEEYPFIITITSNFPGKRLKVECTTVEKSADGPATHKHFVKKTPFEISVNSDMFYGIFHGKSGLIKVVVSSSEPMPDNIGNTLIVLKDNNKISYRKFQ